MIVNNQLLGKKNAVECRFEIFKILIILLLSRYCVLQLFFVVIHPFAHISIMRL